MKKFLLAIFILLLAATAAAGWYAYNNGVRSWSEFVTFAQSEWQRLTAPAPVTPEPAQPEQTQPESQQKPVTPSTKKDTTHKPHFVQGPTETTDRFSIFSAAEGEEFNPLLLGHWTCVEKPTWHRVYTDEYSGNGYYWGKEWDEADDVSEADLVDYGNGWFEWKQDKNDILELATTDMSDTRVPTIYTIRKLNDNDLIYTEHRSQEKRTFIRQTEIK